MKRNWFGYPSLMLVCVLVATHVMGQQKKINRSTEVNSTHRYLYVEEDSVRNSGQTIIRYRDKQEYRIKMINNRVVEMIIDDRKVPEDQFYRYESVVARIREQMRIDIETAILDQKAAEKDMEEAERDETAASEDRKQSAIDLKEAEADELEAHNNMELAGQDQKHEADERRQLDQDEKEAAADMESAKKDRREAELDQKMAERDRAMMKKLVADLMNLKIIKSAEALHSLTLNSNEFTINGQRQPDKLQRDFSRKYLKDPRTEIRVIHDGNRRSSLSVERVPNR